MARLQAMKQLKRICYIGIAVTAFIIGVLGFILPGLPGVVFMLIAAWAAAKGHPGFHKWLRENRYFGEHVRAWEDTRTMPRRAKCYAYAALLAAAAMGCVLFSGWWLALYVAVLACVVAGIALIPVTPA